MKYLVATKDKQGVRNNDFSYADEGHVAIFGSMCDNAKVDDRCGCKRAMVTPSNAKATTTVKVVEFGANELQQAHDETQSFYIDGWGAPKELAIKMTNDELKQNNKIASQFEIGSVLEIRGNTLRTRA